MAKFGIQNNVRALRFEKGELTQQELADMVEATRQTIVSIEKNKYSPSLDLAFRIAKALEVEIGDAFTYKEIKK
mgnify:CR=1 FL=1